MKLVRLYVAEGRMIVVDTELEKFFDRVNHDVLMTQLTRRMVGNNFSAKSDASLRR